VATKNARAVDRREQCPECAADDGAFDDTNDHGSDGSEGQGVWSKGIGNERHAERESQHPAKLNPAPTPQSDAPSNVVNRDGILSGGAAAVDGNRVHCSPELSRRREY
jgi:hypothetical protein